MKILVVKLTSMGDALHLLPALSDLQKQQPDIHVDWMIDSSFAEIPAWHSMVETVIPVATRHWRKPRFNNLREMVQFWQTVRRDRYDLVIDAQGLIKSAIFARLARVKAKGRIGFSADAIKERPAAHLYHQHIYVDRQQHAIKRLRALFANALGYTVVPHEIDYGLKTRAIEQQRQIIFFHATTWASKHLPEQTWQDLCKLAGKENFSVLLPWGNTHEQQRAKRIAQGYHQTRVLPKCSLTELRDITAQCQGAISVDTGLGHLAAALGVPNVSIYGSTNANLTGAVGNRQCCLQSTFNCSPCLSRNCLKLTDVQTTPPCYNEYAAETIWQKLMGML